MLALGFSFPQAFAHITGSTQHMLQHVYNFVDGIEAKTNNLPDDPADQSLLDTQLGSIQSDTDNIQTELANLSPSGATSKATILFFDDQLLDGEISSSLSIGDAADGKNRSGQVSAYSIVSSSVQPLIALRCTSQVSENGFGGGIIASSDDGILNTTFSCGQLTIFIRDLPDGLDDFESVIANIQYVETNNVTPPS